MKLKISLIMIILGFAVTSYCNDFQPDWEGVDWQCAFKHAFRRKQLGIPALLQELKEAVSAQDEAQVASLLEELDLEHRVYEHPFMSYTDNPEFHYIKDALNSLIRSQNSEEISQLLNIYSGLFTLVNRPGGWALPGLPLIGAMISLETELSREDKLDFMIKLYAKQLKDLHDLTEGSHPVLRARINRALERYREYKQSRGAGDQAGPA